MDRRKYLAFVAVFFFLLTLHRQQFQVVSQRLAAIREEIFADLAAELDALLLMTCAMYSCRRRARLRTSHSVGALGLGLGQDCKIGLTHYLLKYTF